jgi:hypothetical protein
MDQDHGLVEDPFPAGPFVLLGLTGQVLQFGAQVGDVALGGLVAVEGVGRRSRVRASSCDDICSSAWIARNSNTSSNEIPDRDRNVSVTTSSSTTADHWNSLPTNWTPNDGMAGLVMAPHRSR